jgi:hypothetical protein
MVRWKKSKHTPSLHFPLHFSMVAHLYTIRKRAIAAGNSVDAPILTRADGKYRRRAIIGGAIGLLVPSSFDILVHIFRRSHTIVHPRDSNSNYVSICKYWKVGLERLEIVARNYLAQLSAKVSPKILFINAVLPRVFTGDKHNLGCRCSIFSCWFLFM